MSHNCIGWQKGDLRRVWLLCVGGGLVGPKTFTDLTAVLLEPGRDRLFCPMQVSPLPDDRKQQPAASGCEGVAPTVCACAKRCRLD